MVGLPPVIEIGIVPVIYVAVDQLVSIISKINLPLRGPGLTTHHDSLADDVQRR